MAKVLSYLERGLWKRVVSRYSDNEVMDPQEVVTLTVEGAIKDAKEVLTHAGFPTIEGSYQENNEGELIVWPLYLNVEPLSLEEFAVQLIGAANAFLENIRSSENSWEHAVMALNFSNSLNTFWMEKTGIAAASVQALQSAKGRRKGRQSQSAGSRRIQVLAAVKAYLIAPGNSRKQKNLTIAIAIAPQFPGVTIESLRNDIRQLKKDGILELKTVPVSI